MRQMNLKNAVESTRNDYHVESLSMFDNALHHPVGKKIKGFSLIELVMVMVIVGILAAIAIPKFLDMRSDARVSSIQTAAGAVRAAASTTHALFLASGTSPVSMDGVSITISNGYAAPSDIALAAGINDGGGLTGTYAVTSGGSSTTISINGATTPASCRVVYNQAVSPSPPVITVTTGGC